MARPLEIFESLSLGYPSVGNSYPKIGKTTVFHRIRLLLLWNFTNVKPPLKNYYGILRGKNQNFSDFLIDCLTEMLPFHKFPAL